MFSKLVQEELDRARAVHNMPFHSAHEGLAIIQEEFEEFKQVVFAKYLSKETFEHAMTGELVQLAAMCQRFYEDLLEKDLPEVNLVTESDSKTSKLKAVWLTSVGGE